MKLAWSEVYRLCSVAVGRGLVAAQERVCETVSLGKEPTGKSGPHRTSGYGGRGQENTLLLCNRGEL